jgi:hypothetical protein
MGELVPHDTPFERVIKIHYVITVAFSNMRAE